MIYFDSAATTMLKPPCVKQAVCDAMDQFGSSGRGAYPAALDAARTIYHCREQLASLFGVSDARRVAFTSGATEALNLAIYGLVQSGDHVITTAAEHNSVLRPLYRLEKQGVELSILPVDEQGNVDFTQLPKYLRQNTRAVVCAHASNVTGQVIDLSYVGRFCRDNGIRCIVDSAQSAGLFPIDMEHDFIDVVCFAGHKTLMGPQGIGGICVAKDVSIRPMKVGGSGVHSFAKMQPQDMPTVLEAGTLNTWGVAGLSAALEYHLQYGAKNIVAKEQELLFRFYRGLKDVKNVKIYGDWSKKRAAIVLMNLGNEDAAWVSDQLAQQYGICTRAGAHCAPLMHEALGTREQGAVRFSFSHFNTEKEIDDTLAAIRTLAEE